MKIFLFLFPIEIYVEVSMTYSTLFSQKGLSVNRLNQIIDARYRQNGYEIYWVLFPQLNEPAKPNWSILSKHIRVAQNDKVVVASVNSALPEVVLSQLPAEIEKLVVGGFHQWDCVNRVAEAAYRGGIDTFVDEDTTELFFVHSSAVGEIPLLRPNPSLSGFMKNGLVAAEFKWLLGFARDERKNKPWFTQEP